MFAKNLVSKSLVDAVSSIINEDEKKRMLLEPELDETGFHKAAHAAKKAGQSHFEFQGKKYPVTAKSHAEAIEVEEATKIPTATGMRVLGSRYGNSAKAEREKTKSSVDDVKGPKTKELKAMEKEPKANLDEAGDCVTKPQAKNIAKKEVKGHEKKMHKEEMTFADKLKASITENKATGTEEIFTDNNLGEEEMSDAQMKKREKIVMSMKKGEAGMKQRYGKNWKNVMYATATKQAMKEDSSDEWEGEQLDEVLAEAATRKDFQMVADLIRANDSHDKRKELASHHAAIFHAQNPRFDHHKFMKACGVSHEVYGEEVKKSDVPAFLRKMRGDKPLSMKDVKSAPKDSISHKDNLAKAKNEGVELAEKNDSHTHAAHYENEKGEWTGMNLFTAKDDDDAVKQAHAKCKKGCRLSKVERHTTVKEDFELIEAEVVVKSSNPEEVTTDMLRGREKGGKSNEFKSVKLQLRTDGEMKAPNMQKPMDTTARKSIDTNKPITNLKNVVGEESELDEKVIAGTPGWKEIPKDVKDKSGAVHTPMSRAKDLARQAFKKIKQETMMGKISN